jgi:hypothetical protein
VNAPFTTAYRAQLDQMRAAVAEAWAESVHAMRDELDDGADPAEAFGILYEVAWRAVPHENVAAAFAYAVLRDAQDARDAAVTS